MIQRTALVSLATLLVSLAACGKKKDDQIADHPGPPGQPLPGSAPAPGSAAPGSAAPGSAAPGSAAPGSAAPGSAAPGSAAPGSAAQHPAQAKTAIAEGTACSAGMQLVTDAPLTITATTASFSRGRGGGCPTKAVYTLLYSKASPTELRVCFDPTADTCEMYIQNETVSFELAAALQGAGATAAVAGK